MKYLNFGGFYCSQHGELIDYISQDVHECLEKKDDFETQISLYKDLKEAYAAEYLYQFEVFLSDDFKLDVSLDYKGIDSPLYYNYRTDYITYELSDEDSSVLYDYYLENKDKVIEYIKEVYFSSYKDILKDATKDDLIQYTLDYLAKEFNEVLYQENIYLNDLEDALYRVLDKYLCED